MQSGSDSNAEIPCARCHQRYPRSEIVFGSLLVSWIERLKLVLASASGPSSGRARAGLPEHPLGRDPVAVDLRQRLREKLLSELDGTKLSLSGPSLRCGSCDGRDRQTKRRAQLRAKRSHDAEEDTDETHQFHIHLRSAVKAIVSQKVGEAASRRCETSRRISSAIAISIRVSGETRT